MVDFNEAYKDHKFKKELRRRMNMKHYPPRYHYEIVDLTRDCSFFCKPKIVEYCLKGGKIDTMDGEGKIIGKIVIPSLNTAG